MVRRLAVGVAVLAMVLVWGCGRAEGSGSPVEEARAAFKKCAAAVKAGDMGTAKGYVSTEMLAETDDGQLPMLLGMVAVMDIDEFTGTMDGGKVVFEKKESGGDMSVTMSLRMVNEGGRWKLGR